MQYAKWSQENEIKNILKKINKTTEISKSGLPIMYDEENLYIEEKESHNLIIGATGSGKTQTTILPLIKLSMLANESIVVNDFKGELYQNTASILKDKGYDIKILNFEDPSLGNNWNPYTLPYILYNENKDKTIYLLEELARYLLNDKEDKNIDSFWINSSIDYFTGLSLYLFENAKENEINLNSLYSLSNTINDNDNLKLFINKLDKSSSIYTNLSGTLNSPEETRGGIISTFNQRIKKYISRETLSNMLSANDLDIKNISNNKTAIFLVSGYVDQGNHLIPLLTNQIVESVNIYGNKQKRLNIILDEFDELIPINNFSKMLCYSRGYNIRFTLVIKSYISLINNYGKEDTELLKLSIGNILYLWSNDIYTLEEISKTCGNEEKDNKIIPLISIEELKTMKKFEAIVLIPRMMPYKTKLIPDYIIDYGFTIKKQDIPKRNSKNIEIYNWTK